MTGLGWSGIALLALIGLLLFGPSKLPQLGRAVGTTIREFRSGAKELAEPADSRTNRDDRNL